MSSCNGVHWICSWRVDIQTTFKGIIMITPWYYDNLVGVGLSTQNPAGLISDSTFIGFIIWLILLTFITLALLAAMTVQFRAKEGRPLSKRASTGASMCYDGPYNPREEEREDRERSARSLELRNPALFGTLHLRPDTSAHTATSEFV